MTSLLRHDHYDTRIVDLHRAEYSRASCEGEAASAAADFGSSWQIVVVHRGAYRQLGQERTGAICDLEERCMAQRQPLVPKWQCEGGEGGVMMMMMVMVVVVVVAMMRSTRK